MAAVERYGSLMQLLPAFLLDRVQRPSSVDGRNLGIVEQGLLHVAIFRYNLEE